MLIESEQALYRGDGYYWPKEIWGRKEQVWKPYKGKVPKEPGWGDIVTEAEAEDYKNPLANVGN